MCIVCNCGDIGVDFLNDFRRASMEMDRAIKTMKLCSEKMTTEKTRQMYDHIYKMMIQQRREWNYIEQIREIAAERNKGVIE